MRGGEGREKEMTDKVAINKGKIKLNCNRIIADL